MMRTSTGNMRRSRHRTGFTLIEVLIAIALALVLGVTMFAFLQDLLATRARTIEFASRQRAAATLIERLESDVAACLVGDSINGAGVQGDAERLRLLTRGVMTQLASRGLDDPEALADLHAVEYRFNASSQTIDARKNLVGETSELTSLGGPISHVRFRFLDGRVWTDAFDSLALGRLPNAIEVCVWFNPWPGEAATSAVTQPVEFTGNFDEQAYAAESDAKSFRPPPPDRRRVIVIPDGGAEETSDAAE